MKKRPLLLKFLVGVYLLAPLLGVLQLYFLAAGKQFVWLGFDGLDPFYAQFTPLRTSILALYPLVAVFLFSVRKLSWVVYSLHSVFLVGLNSYEIYHHQSFPFGLLLFILLGGFGSLVIYYRNSLREIFYNPRMRWWEVADRYACLYPIDIRSDDQTGVGFITDLSKTGCFFYSEMKLTHFSEFKFEFNPAWAVASMDVVGNGLIVRTVFEKELGLNGYGVHFRNRTSEFKKAISKLLKQLRDRGAVDRLKPGIPEIRAKITAYQERLKVRSERRTHI